MTFNTEKNWVVKTDLSDLQGSWSCLRDAVLRCETISEKERLIFHIEEATSWESVRDLTVMGKALLVIRNIIGQSDADNEVVFWLEDVNDMFQESLTIHGK